MEMPEDLENDILDKLYRYLSYQERCRDDIEKKLLKLQVAQHNHSQYINYLESENYLNEERFVRSYIKSKIQNNKWGKKKVRYSLSRKNLPERLVNRFLNEFSDEEYQTIAGQLAKKKNASVKTDDFWKRKQKIYRYLAKKGFESSVITQAIEEAIDSENQ